VRWFLLKGFFLECLFSRIQPSHIEVGQHTLKLAYFLESNFLESSYEFRVTISWTLRSISQPVGSHSEGNISRAFQICQHILCSCSGGWAIGVFLDPTVWWLPPARKPFPLTYPVRSHLQGGFPHLSQLTSFPLTQLCCQVATSLLSHPALLTGGHSYVHFCCSWASEVQLMNPSNIGSYCLARWS
jgi:hypothetical protein